MRLIYLLIAVFTIYGQAYASDANKEISEEVLLRYATSPYYHVDKNIVSMGRLNGAPVVAEFICSDICPDYTVRVIHYDLKKGQTCDEVGGIEKEILVPVSIAATKETFCFPKVIVDNWKKYRRKISHVPTKPDSNK